MFDPSKIIDTMGPIEYRFRKYCEFTEFILPLTKLNEQYYLIKQIDKKYNSIHYYIITTESLVIGRFDASFLNLDCSGLTYRIVEEYQNRGIGQVALGTIINDLFGQNVNKIWINAINGRSAAIALKNGFTFVSKTLYELKLLDYNKNKEKQQKQI